MSIDRNLRKCLRKTVCELNLRGQKVAAKFSNELLVGMKEITFEDTQSQENVSFVESIEESEVDLVNFSTSLIDSGEYQRCVCLWSKHGRKIQSSVGLFQYFYASFMVRLSLRLSSYHGLLYRV